MVGSSNNKLPRMGSESNDLFKFLHKGMNKKLWAVDADLELIEKEPVPFVVARLDLKMKHSDPLTFTEAISYGYLIGLPEPNQIPVYIITPTCEFTQDIPKEQHSLRVEKITGAHFLQPSFRKTVFCENLTWKEFEQWEIDLRAYRKKYMSQWMRDHPRSEWPIWMQVKPCENRVDVSPNMRIGSAINKGNHGDNYSKFQATHRSI